MRLILLPMLAVLFIISACTKNKEASLEPIENNKALTWTKTYGGSDYEFANAIIQLQDGNFVVAGATRSSGGDIGGNRVGYDAWLSKIDNAGNKVWSKTFGANDDEYGTALIPTADGGFIMTGYLFVNYKNYAWAIKTDAAGNQQWRKELASGDDAKPLSVITTGDGSCIVTGYASPVSGNRDGWIIKLDAAGNQVWSKTYGGFNEDQFTSVTKTSGGYILAGYTNSSNGEIQTNKGNYDGWVMKIDENGNKVWSKNFGGTDEDYLKCVIQTSDGGIMAVGYTKSGNGDVPENKGGFDEWLVKLDAGGAKQWTKTYGGRDQEYVTGVVNTRDGGFLTIGYSNSTTGDVYRRNNDFGGWLLKMDINGNKTAASTYGVDTYDEFTNTVINTSDGGYAIAGYRYVETRGYDAWVVKITDL